MVAGHVQVSNDLSLYSASWVTSAGSDQPFELALNAASFLAEFEATKPSQPLREALGCTRQDATHELLLPEVTNRLSSHQTQQVS